MVVVVEPLPITPWFAWSCAELRRACARLGLESPAFRSPPAVPGADRTLRRVPGERARVAIRLWGRSFDAIRTDMVDGVLAANGVARTDPHADELRARLQEAVPLPEQREAA